MTRGARLSIAAEMANMLKILSNRLSAWMEILAGTALIGVMLLIGSDIAGRIFGHPIPGAYEMVSMAGGLIIGLAAPGTSVAKAHVSTDLLLGRLSGWPRSILIVSTRLIGIAIFLLLGYSMLMMGLRLKDSGEVTAVLAFPFYYAVYAMSGAFFIQSLVFVSEISETLNRESGTRGQR